MTTRKISLQPNRSAAACRQEGLLRLLREGEETQFRSGNPLDGWVEQLTALPGRVDAIEAAFAVKTSEGLCVIGNRGTNQTQTATKYLEEFGEIPAAVAIVAIEKGACAPLPRRRYPRYP